MLTKNDGKQISQDSSSPVIKPKKKNKENNLDELNPMSERGSMMSLKKSRKSFQNRNTALPPHKNALKEKSMAQLSNLSY